ncbi:MAG: replicative DNA helicase [bacterium P3]|nr:MAG: replicative DNA helicase [bacterium P3]KWW42175.1 MAG: replicative DNA helicase [bacterium F083]
MSYEAAFNLNGKTPPQAVELEESVLGALMLDQNALNNTIEILHPEYFYKPEHQTIFKAIYHLFELSQPVDMLTVIERLRLDGALEAAGGAYYVSQLTNHVVSAAHIEYHVRVLSEKFFQRELIRICTEVITDAYDESNDILTLLDNTEQRLMDINDRNFRSDYRTMDSLVYEAVQEIKKVQESDNDCVGIPSGFRELDQITAGFQPGTLIILAARPAMGKTALALTMARNMAVDFKKPVAFFSLEMTGIELVKRLISSETEITGDKLKKGGLAAWEQEILVSRTQMLNDAPIYIDDTPGLSIFELRAKCRRLKQKYDIQMVFIDYLQLMNAGGEASRNGNREQEISAISRQLKALSKELNIPILAMAQLSRAVETRGGDKKPILSDLRESGAIEQDADIVAFIYRPDYYGMTEPDEKGPTRGMADVIIAKHRSGSVGSVRLKFTPNFARFENVEFVAPSQYADGIAANEQFDSFSSLQSTITVDSSMNGQNDFPADNSDAF